MSTIYISELLHLIMETDIGTIKRFERIKEKIKLLKIYKVE